MTRRAQAPTAEVPYAPVRFASLPAAGLGRGARRLDGETYLTGGYAVRCHIEAGRTPFLRLADLADVWMPGRLKAVPVAPGKGVPYLAASQMFDINPVPRKWLSVEHTGDLNALYVDPGLILVARSGTDNVGDVLMSYAAHAGLAVSDDLLRVRPKNPPMAGYLYAFLRGRHGYSMLRSSQYGSVIKHLEPEHLADLPVPVPSDSVRQEASDGIGRAYQLRGQALAQEREAEARFARAIGAAPGGSLSETGFAVSSAHLTGGSRRLDGYYYNPRAAAVLSALRQSGRETVTLGSQVGAILLPNRFKRQRAADGLPFVGIEELFKVNPRIDKHIKGTADELADYFVRSGWLLVARSGQIYGLFGSVALAGHWHESKVITEDIIRIVPAHRRGAPRPGYIRTALSHPVYGRPLVVRTAFGTSVPHLAPADLDDFPLIRLSPSEEDDIASLVEEAGRFREEADDLENRAVAGVERAIDRLLATAGGSGGSNVRDEFAALVREWKIGRNALSTAKRMAEHPAYQAIIRLGREAVPLIIEELRREPDHWFIALHVITGASPVPEESRGKLSEMTRAWVEWWEREGHAR